MKGRERFEATLHVMAESLHTEVRLGSYGSGEPVSCQESGFLKSRP